MIDNLREIHPLREKFGYSVAKNISIWRRQTALMNGVAALGLWEVVYHVSGQVRLRKCQEDDRWEGCIERWEEDLEWLKRRYYDTGLHRFLWPEY